MTRIEKTVTEMKEYCGTNVDECKSCEYKCICKRLNLTPDAHDVKIIMIELNKECAKSDT